MTVIYPVIFTRTDDKKDTNINDNTGKTANTGTTTNNNGKTTTGTPVGTLVQNISTGDKIVLALVVLLLGIGSGIIVFVVKKKSK